jgi:nitrogen fixation protein FixH
MFRDGRYWPFLIVALLSVSVVANVLLLIKATDDPAFAVERDYYAKAVRWDQHQQDQADSDALGWRAALKAAPERLEVRLLDRDGRPITDAVVKVEAFHNARANRIITGELSAEGGGLYALSHHFDRRGLWEYRLVAERSGERFVHTSQEEIR